MFYLSYLITLMAYLCLQRTSNVQIRYFNFHWSNSSLFMLNKTWKRDSLQMMILVNVCSTWSMVQLKTRLETWITLSDVNSERFLHLSYLITLMVYLRSQRTPNVQIKYFMFDWSIFTPFVLNRGWKRDPLQIMIFVYACSTWSILELKTRFKAWITINDVNGVSLFHFSCLIKLISYLCSQCTRNVK
jgi:hypothetical protein